MAADPNKEIQDFILQEWRRKIPEEVTVAAQRIAERFNGAVCGILFYGSCLRTGDIIEKVLDFYVIVDTYSAAYDNRWLAVANQVLPPNVFYHETEVNGVTVRSKYAVLSRADLAFRVRPECLNVSVWARFCQPCLLMLARDEETKKDIASDIVQAVKTMLGSYLDLVPSAKESRDLWVGAFEQTYSAELRSERSGKGLEIYLLDQDRYDALTALVEEVLNVVPDPFPPLKQPSRTERLAPRLRWMLRRWNGKAVSFLRLVKASVTFDGGIDYLAWKIKRHSGVEVEVTDRMRRRPVLSGIRLFWGLKRRGAFK
ncbi:hypothetical protein [Kordiimonas aestuarii]|uniref:hypothetical protein n=1 Tax=Kordiimonas aestuarii TaxID=1005925 RepID=UPI0021CF1F87|nr:hypothetical protein [Kordiimonas aestuarii]